MTSSQMRTPRRLACSAVALLLAGTAVADASPSLAGRGKTPKKTRTETYEYVATLPNQVGVFLCEELQGCLTLEPQPGEQYLSVEVADHTGTPVPFSVFFGGTLEGHCGRTSRPVWFAAEEEVQVHIWSTGGGCTGAGTAGTVTFTFSNVKK